MRGRLVLAIRPYEELLRKFVAAEVDADTFQTEFMTTYLSLDDDYGYDVFKVVDGFFADVDSYVAEERLREPGDLSEAELRKKTAGLLEQAGLGVVPS